MDGFLEPREKQKIVSPGLILGVLIGLFVITAGIWYVMRQPTMEQQMAAVLEGSYREGAPEFEDTTKDIIISTTEDKTVESPNAFGSISMFISGKIRNKGQRVINGLEVNVAVIDSFSQVLKEKRVLVVPTQQATLEPNEIIPISLEISGFDPKDDRANIRWKVTAIRIAN